MAGKLFILRAVADFAPGFFDNAAVEDGCVQLSRQGQGFAGSGVYTSVPFSSGDFYSLLPSWNADTPPGTSVEVQARVASEGRWSAWLSLGEWSPYIRRASVRQAEDAVAVCRGETVNLAKGRAAADLAQLRVLLKTADSAQSPRLRLLAFSTDATRRDGQRELPVFDRELPLPAYSCQLRDPAIAGRIASPAALCMLMNRYGCDLLPEEVARAAYDYGANRFGQLPFLCALAGGYGLYSYAAYADVAALRREVWMGRAVAARVHYRAPALPGQAPEAGDGRAVPPVLEGAHSDSGGHLVAVRGFVQRGGGEHVVLNDPLAAGDETVRREIPLSSFEKIFTGVALFLEKSAPAPGAAPPRRRVGRLDVRGGLLRLYGDGGELVPARLLDGSLTPFTLCYTLSDGIAYASAAQRRFYYPAPDEHGAVRFEQAAAAGRRITCFLVGPEGDAWVAEKQLD